jgi:hypothetical protein
MAITITVTAGGTTAADSAVGDTAFASQGPPRFQYRGGLFFFSMAAVSGFRLPKNLPMCRSRSAKVRRRSIPKAEVR